MPPATQDLQQRLRRTATVLRALADTEEYKDYLLRPLLLKLLPDHSDVDVETAEADGFPREAGMNDRDKH